MVLLPPTVLPELIDLLKPLMSLSGDQGNDLVALYSKPLFARAEAEKAKLDDEAEKLTGVWGTHYEWHQPPDLSWGLWAVVPVEPEVWWTAPL